MKQVKELHTWHKKFIIWPTVIWVSGDKHLVWLKTVIGRLHNGKWQFRVTEK